MSASIKFIYTASAARSGSTLLAFLLNAHPDIVSIAEMTGIIMAEDPEEYMCSCGRLIKDCDFWQGVTQNMQDQGFEFDYNNFDTGIMVSTNKRTLKRIQKSYTGIAPLDLMRNDVLAVTPGIGKILNTKVERNIALARSILQASHKQFILDTAKDITRIHYLNRHKYIDLHVIHLTRDVRGFIASQARRDKETTAVTFAKRWAKLNRNIEIQLLKVPQAKHILVRYEDLCTNTLSTLQRITEFVGASDIDEVPEFRAVPHHIIGAKMRLQSSSEIELDERWRTEISAEDQQAIKPIVQKMMDRYGYE